MIPFCTRPRVWLVNVHGVVKGLLHDAFEHNRSHDSGDYSRVLLEAVVSETVVLCLQICRDFDSVDDRSALVEATESLANDGCLCSRFSEVMV